MPKLGSKAPVGRYRATDEVPVAQDGEGASAAGDGELAVRLHRQGADLGQGQRELQGPSGCPEGRVEPPIWVEPDEEALPLFGVTAEAAAGHELAVRLEHQGVGPQPRGAGEAEPYRTSAPEELVKGTVRTVAGQRDEAAGGATVASGNQLAVRLHDQRPGEVVTPEVGRDRAASTERRVKVPVVCVAH